MPTKLNKPVSAYLLMVLMFLLPWQTRLIYKAATLNTGFWEYGSQSLFGTEILLGLTLLIFLIEQFFNAGFIANLRIQTTNGAGLGRAKWLVLAVGYLTFIFLISSNRPLVFYKYENLLTVLCFGMLIYLYRKHLESLSTAFWAGGVGQGMLALYQFFTQEIFANKWLGIASHSAKELGTFVVEFGDERWLRAYGSFGSPNILGGFLVITFLVGLKLYLETEPSVKKILLMVGELVILAGLILSFSRAALLALMVGILFTLLHSWRGKMLKLQTFDWLKLGLTSFAVVALLVLTYRPLFAARLAGAERLEQQSNLTRQEEYRQWWGLARTNLVFGLGPGLYTYTLFLKNPSLPAWQYQPIHNTFLLILGEWGIVGSLLWLLLFWLLTREFKYRIYWPLFGVLIILAALDHYWWSLYGGMMLGAVVLTLAIIYLENKNPAQ